MLVCSTGFVSFTGVAVSSAPMSVPPKSKSFGGRAFISSSSGSLAIRSCSSKVKASERFTAKNVLGNLTLEKKRGDG